MGEFEDKSAEINRQLNREIEALENSIERMKVVTMDVRRLGEEADAAVGGGEPPPVAHPIFVPKALPRLSNPDGVAPALVDWAYLIKADVGALPNIEIKATQRVAQYDGVTPIPVEAAYADRSIVDPGVKGLILTGDATHSKRSGPYLRLDFSRQTEVTVVVENSRNGLAIEDIYPEVGEFDVGTVMVKRGNGPARIYAAWTFRVPEGRTTMNGMNDKGNFYFLIIQDEAPFKVVPPSHAQHTTYGSTMEYAGKIFGAFHLILDRDSGNLNNHEHGFLTLLAGAGWNIVDDVIKSGFKCLETVIGKWIVIFNVHMHTSSPARLFKREHTFDISVWDAEDGSFAGFVPLLKSCGPATAVYGGNIVKDIGPVVAPPSRQKRNLTVALPPGFTSRQGKLYDPDGNVVPWDRAAPHTSNPGYETWQYYFDEPGSVMRGPFVLSTDNPASRLRYKPLDSSGNYPYTGPDDFILNTSDADQDASRRWFIFPDWERGVRTTLDQAYIDIPLNHTYGGKGFKVWTHIPTGSMLEPYINGDIEEGRILASIREDVSFTFPGDEGKYYRIETNGRYLTQKRFGSYIPRIPLGYGYVDPSVN